MGTGLATGSVVLIRTDNASLGQAMQVLQIVKRLATGSSVRTATVDPSMVVQVPQIATRLTTRGQGNRLRRNKQGIPNICITTRLARGGPVATDGEEPSKAAVR